jgi:putative sigma-54 modulation protein
MKVAFTGRNLVVTPAMQEFTTERLEKLDRWLDGISEAHVILAKEKYRHIAEVVVKGKNAVFSGTQETEDMYSSIGKVLEKIEHQAKKHREKHTVVKRRRGRKAGGGNGAEPEDVVEEVVLATLAEGQHVLRDDDYPLKPMTLEEAALRLEADGKSFLVFRDAGSQRFGVLYRRGDGNLGLVQPNA